MTRLNRKAGIGKIGLAVELPLVYLIMVGTVGSEDWWTRQVVDDLLH
jgi:hypothetical protein